MADADPGLSWAARRKKIAREMQRRSVAHAAAGTTDMAPGPFANLASVYTDPVRFAAEKERLFGGDMPLVAGLSVDIAKPGDRMLFEETGVPIIIMRGKDGVARAFLNMCTHRGAKLTGECGNAARLTCPFHAWTFDLEGKLLALPGARGFEGYDKADLGLVPVPCQEWNGLVFVQPRVGATPVDVEAFLGSFAPELAQLELGKAEPVKAGEMRAASNWKFALDTYGESYHFSTLHASTIGQTHFNDMTVYDQFGRNHRVSFPDRTALPLASLPESEWPEVDYGGVHYLFPNTVLFIGSIEPGKGFTQIFRLFPGESPGQMVTKFAVYAPKGVQSDQHRAECEYAFDATSQVVSTEDYVIAANGWTNMANAPADLRIIYGANEMALPGVHRAIAEAIGMPLE
jgi:phenylpropionate dioxygenase-like ring-hydroxylating dioxygenase large terminal subunit